MIEHVVRVHPSSTRLPRESQLAFAIAAFAAGQPPLDLEAVDMAACRVLDNAAVALASLDRTPVAVARAQALAHPRAGGATLFGAGAGAEATVHAEWAAWANAVAVRELDFHDTFLSVEFGHPGDNIPPLIAVAQQCGRDGEALARGILVAYEVHVALMKGINLHVHKKDHLAHLAPATAAGIGAMLALPAEVIFHAVNLAVHLSFSTRQSRKGEISSWKACVPGFSGKLAVESVDRAMRGEAAPSPIYEGEDSVIAWMLGGPEAEYRVFLPSPGEAPRAILETYTKAHSAEYQAQAFIDLACDVGRRIDLDRVREIVIHTSNHTHTVIGTGANDPQKLDPDASRETLDHSLMYITAVALEDGFWHHEASYTRERSHRAASRGLWRRIRTLEDPVWNARYLDPDPGRRAFGGRMEVVMEDGSVIEAEKAVADAHPNGLSPWGWDDYVGKLQRLAGGVVEDAERERLVTLAARLQRLAPGEVRALNPSPPPGRPRARAAAGPGIFDHPG
jgi:2-methylcitrate dehydratase